MSRFDRSKADSCPMLVFLGANRSYYRSPVYSNNEIYCGPRCETVVENGVYRSIQMKPGEFDIADFIGKLPADQKPDIVVVQIDRTGQTLARNLSKIDCIKILQITDTHHLVNPITFIMNYLQTEKYDIIIDEPCRQHMHFFTEAGFPRVHWLPLINLNVFPQPQGQPQIHDALFIGQTGRFHPVRQEVLKHLQQNGIPLKMGQADQKAAAQAFAQAAVSLNVSLNGDFNLRVLEVLGAGGFLLTDRVSRQCGVAEMFEDGKELVFYDDEDDLLEKTRYYLTDAGRAEAQEIRRRGQARCLREHAHDVKIRQFFDLVLSDREEPAFALDRDLRCRRPRAIAATTLLARLRAYEYAQEVHRRIVHPCLLATSGVSDLLLGDVADLVRMRISVETHGDAARIAQRQAAFTADGVADRIGLTSRLTPGSSKDGTVLLAAAGDIGRLTSAGDGNLIDQLARPTHILIENGRQAVDMQTLSALTDTLKHRGYALTDANLPGYQRVT